jgi:glycine/serine hydroxymethyltransferase
METIAAVATALKIASTPQFAELQKQTVRNAAACGCANSGGRPRGLRRHGHPPAPHGLQADQGAGRHAVDGDPAANLLDLAGIVANRKPSPATHAAYPSGIRHGHALGHAARLKEPEMQRLGRRSASSCTPRSPTASCAANAAPGLPHPRGFRHAGAVKLEIAALAADAGVPIP